MRCFYLPEAPLSVGKTVEIPEDLQRHLGKVLRLQAGAEIQLFDGCGNLADSVLRERGLAEIQRVRSYPQPVCRLTLIQGIPKGDKLELVLQKGTELGVNRFALVEMERSVGQVKSERRERRIGRWNKIIQEAARQCRQYHMPELEYGTSFRETLGAIEAERKLILWEESGTPLTEVLSRPPVGSIAVVVGPEGGISSEEVRQAEKLGFSPVSLGPRILRTETAGLAIMAILQYLYGDLVSGQ
jgi:16S rRNA (uracil1498-N3)-methyltransferase